MPSTIKRWRRKFIFKFLPYTESIVISCFRPASENAITKNRFDKRLDRGNKKQKFFSDICYSSNYFSISIDLRIDFFL